MQKTSATLAACFTLLCIGAMRAQNDWLYLGQDQGASRYSDLKQIDTTNVQTLTHAWPFHTGSIVYLAASNGIYAIDGVTGDRVWKYPPAVYNDLLITLNRRFSSRPPIGRTDRFGTSEKCKIIKKVCR
ncbi:MAG: hypothetical protein P4L56_21650 [Candidatus Sulfopaludibacter sp.]|nr:hypothetical protein [Candidatus Sulfopaludibacter sp.]